MAMSPYPRGFIWVHLDFRIHLDPSDHKCARADATPTPTPATRNVNRRHNPHTVPHSNRDNFVNQSGRPVAVGL
jgi:hypothetical protein